MNLVSSLNRRLFADPVDESPGRLVGCVVGKGPDLIPIEGAGGR